MINGAISCFYLLSHRIHDSFLSANSDSLDVNVVETAGYAVIIQGKISNEEGLASHNKTTNAVYKQLRNIG